MKRLITVLASIALLGTLFVGAPKPVFASVTEIYYIGVGGGSDTGCGNPDIWISPDGTVVAPEDTNYLDLDWALQAALNLADDGDIIQLCTSVTDGSDIWYVNNDASLWDGDQNAAVGIVDPINLTIQGLGADETVLSGDYAYRLFNFANVNLTLKGLRLINGDSRDAVNGESGGAIRFEGGSLAIENVEFEDFYSRESGGAIYTTQTLLSGTTTVTIDGSSFEGISAENVGGAIYAYCANMTISDTLFYDNSAGYAGGAILAYGDDLQCSETGSLTIEDGTRFTSNDIHDDFGGTGGGGGAVASAGQPVTITDSVFGYIDGSGVSLGNDNTEGNGGALFVDGTTGTNLVIENSRFFDSFSGDKGGAIYSSCASISVDGENDFTAEEVLPSTKFVGNRASYDGGAIYLDAEDCFENVDSSFTGVLFEDNTSGYQGGAISTNQTNQNWLTGVNIYRSSFIENTSLLQDGGAINSDYNDISISDSSFIGNTAIRGGVAELCSANLTVTSSFFYGNSTRSGGDGGVLWTGGDCGRDANDVTITGSRFVGNSSADDGGVLAIFKTETVLTLTGSEFSENIAEDDGGAIFMQWSDEVSITDSIFEGNTSEDDGGAIEHENGYRFTIANSEFTDNSSGTDDGSQSDGGAISFGARTDGFLFQVTNSTFSGNYAAGDDGGALEINADGEQGSIVILGSSFLNNTSEEEGGAMDIDLDVDATLEISRTSFVNNSAWADGGAINQDTDSDGTNVTITNSTFNANTADSDGGAMDLTDKVVLSNNIFTNNSTEDGQGGAIELNEDTGDSSLTYLFALTGNVFRNNSANGEEFGEGGGVVAGASSIITRNTFIANSSDSDGGAIRLGTAGGFEAFHNISNNRFERNSSGDDGGAVYVGDSSSGITFNTFIGNSADDDGGALDIRADVEVRGNTFSGNVSGYWGGAVAARDLTFPLSRITDNLFDSNRSAVEGGALWINFISGVEVHKLVIASNRIIRNSSPIGAGLYIGYPGGATLAGQTMTGIVRNTFERNIASQYGGAIAMEYIGGAYRTARAAQQALAKAVKNNRYKGNKANLDRATGDIAGIVALLAPAAAKLEVRATGRAPEAE